MKSKAVAATTKPNQPQLKLVWIHEQLNAGKTIYLSTAYRHTKVQSSATASWALRVKGTTLELRRGKRWDDVNGCRITARDER